MHECKPVYGRPGQAVVLIPLGRVMARVSGAGQAGTGAWHGTDATRIRRERQGTAVMAVSFDWQKDRGAGWPARAFGGPR